MTAKDAFESLPVVDLAKCRVVHLPVYDCVSDLFERPCSHDLYEWGGYNEVGIGFTDADKVRQLLQRADNDDGAAVVNGGDHLYVLLADIRGAAWCKGSDNCPHRAERILHMVVVD